MIDSATLHHQLDEVLAGRGTPEIFRDLGAVISAAEFQAIESRKFVSIAADRAELHLSTADGLSFKFNGRGWWGGTKCAVDRVGELTGIGYWGAMYLERAFYRGRELIDQMIDDRKTGKMWWDHFPTVVPAPPPKKKKPARGFVYILRNAAGLYKIGMSCKPEQRLRDLQCAQADTLKLVYKRGTKRMEEAERELHFRFKQYRRKGEWFAIPHDHPELLKLLPKSKHVA